MIDLKFDPSAVQAAKDLKINMLNRLKQIDLENQGQITLESFISIAEKYGIKLSQSDIQLIRDKYRKIPQNVFSNKVEYMRLLNDIHMKLESDGSIQWVFSNQKDGSNTSPYRIMIQRMNGQPSDGGN